VKIRSQFALLLLGILVMPFLSMALILLYDYYRSPERIEVPSYADVSAQSGSNVDRAAWERVSRFISRRPKRIEHVVLDGSSRVLYSTIPSIARQSALSGDEVLALVRETREKYLWQIEISGEGGASALTVFTLLERRNHRPPDPFLRIFVWVLLFIGMVFVLAAVIIVSVTQSIAKSVTGLETSTRRIANGELDIPVELKGSNEITSLAVSLNRMRLALKEESSRKSRFIMGVSHDLKTPLALIKGYAEAISDGYMDDPGARAKSLSLIASKVDQLGAMIDDLIGYVKLDSEDWKRSLRTLDLASVVGSAIGRMADDAKLLGRELSFESHLAAPAPVPMDERLFMRSLENIVTNAIRYTEEGGRIDVTLEEAGGTYVLAVRDDGCGIAGEDLPHVFELFYRGTSSRREEGMGLGLSIVKSVVDSHGWKIAIDSLPGRGTLVKISIPRR